MVAKKKVLLIEDEKMLVDMYTTKFEMEGYEVIPAYDGDEGLKLAQEKKPDIVLLDIILPKYDGFWVLKKIKEDPELKRIPVILLTNLGQELDVKKGKELGADDYFIKANHSPAEVAKKINDLLKK